MFQSFGSLVISQQRIVKLDKKHQTICGRLNTALYKERLITEYFVRFVTDNIRSCITMHFFTKVVCKISLYNYYFIVFVKHT